MPEPLCQAQLPHLAARGAVIFLACGEPAAAFWRYSCEHGHFSYRWVCLIHQRQQSGCRQCFGQGREVPMTAELVRDG